MSARGIDFLDRWLAENLPTMVGADVISVGKATEKLLHDAKREGIDGPEITESAGGSVYETILDAIVHYQSPGITD
ncbi:DUF768 domain-containing protein [Mesorhizobium sp. C120A]|uniref:DUF768 domain-containing protein n=1 Tax=unclassified Mesorhizobium TaxID=325217 RepID=UPI0003CFD745|nr:MULTISPECIES: DUF768 domain-containing protein [unclassified Mesorhizobium]ESZ63497.1 hypothetical protein X728_09030 [Mesorhizobium sp. L103C120A0]WJI45075.1 DUF768 domain-containing protein [Mesorhizobium sp. C120A]